MFTWKTLTMRNIILHWRFKSLLVHDLIWLALTGKDSIGSLILIIILCHTLQWTDDLMHLYYNDLSPVGKSTIVLVATLELRLKFEVMHRHILGNTSISFNWWMRGLFISQQCEWSVIEILIKLFDFKDNP